jgi:hypothetical protein
MGGPVEEAEGVSLMATKRDLPSRDARRGWDSLVIIA